MSKSTVTFVAAKRKRNELTLPTLYFPVADAHGENWIDVLGEKAFCGWLKMHTLVDRTEKAKKENGNLLTIPRSITNLSKDVFGVSKTTFYRTIIKPLWNYGLIDLQEWSNDPRTGQKSINIIVYPYPQNDKMLETQPLEKVRDYDVDYSSNAQIYGKKGGRPKGSLPNRFKNETVRSIRVSKKKLDRIHRFKNKTGGRFKNETGAVSKIKPNNSSNTVSNTSNTDSHISNTSSSTKQKEDDVTEEYKSLYEEFLTSFFTKAQTSEVIVQIKENYKERLVPMPVLEKAYHALMQAVSVKKIAHPVNFFLKCVENEMAIFQLEKDHIHTNGHQKTSYDNIPGFSWLENLE